MSAELDAVDKSWLDRHAVSVCCAGAVVAVAARTALASTIDGIRGVPSVIKMYPLRWDPKGRGSGCGGPVPWPNLYFLVCPKLIRAVGGLEDAGWIQIFEQRLQTDEELMGEHIATHESFAVERWDLLTPEDRAYAVTKGYDGCLRDSGVCGLQYKRKIKCLHAHYAYHLARKQCGGTLIGHWVDEQLRAATAAASELGGSLCACR